MSHRIPHLLEQYLALPPEAALILLTSVLGASSNWLVLRFLYSHLKLSNPAEAAGFETTTSSNGGSGSAVGIVLVSFMRDGAFWRDGAGRMGLDLDAMSRSGRFAFVDGLTGLFSGEEGQNVVGGAPNGRSDRVLRSSKVRDVEAGIIAALGQLRTEKKVLIIDQMDVLLAASEEDVTSSALSGMLLSLREVHNPSPALKYAIRKLTLLQSVHSTVLTLSADHPLLHSQATTLEREHESLVLGQAHAADRVFALRMLDTGTAKDVSGVVRITRGGGAVDEEGTEDDEGKEYLYHVAGDGGVRVFERGS